MSMSRDRVIFKIPVNRLEDPELAKVLAIVLGIGRDEVDFARRSGRDLRVACLPDQFGRFIVLRNRYGLGNQIKELCPSLVSSGGLFAPLGASDCAASWCVDVSRRPSHINPKYDEEEPEHIPWLFEGEAPF